jgi:hypothetical protein
MLPRHRRESLEKIVDRFARLKIVKQRFHRNPRPMEHGYTPHYVGSERDNWLFQ